MCVLLSVSAPVGHVLKAKIAGYLHKEITIFLAFQFAPWRSCFDAQVLRNSGSSYGYCCLYESNCSIGAVSLVFSRKIQEYRQWLLQFTACANCMLMME